MNIFCIGKHTVYNRYRYTEANITESESAGEKFKAICFKKILNISDKAFVKDF